MNIQCLNIMIIYSHIHSKLLFYNKEEKIGAPGCSLFENLVFYSHLYTGTLVLEVVCYSWLILTHLFSMYKVLVQSI